MQFVVGYLVEVVVLFVIVICCECCAVCAFEFLFCFLFFSIFLSLQQLSLCGVNIFFSSFLFSNSFACLTFAIAFNLFVFFFF